MLTVKSWDSQTMNWNKKGTLLMLAMAVLWTALPASACLLASPSTAQPDCCLAMAAACGTAQMGADTSCCELRGTIPPAVSVQAYSPVPLQTAALHEQIEFNPLAAVAGRFASIQSTPPPKFPPGGFSLRI